MKLWAILRGVARSTPARLVGLHVLNSLVGGGLVMLFVFHATDRLLRDDLQDVLQSEVRVIAGQLRSDGRTGAVREVTRLLGPDARQGAVILLVDPRGKRIAGNLEDWPATVPVTTRWRELRLFPLNSDEPRLVGVATSVLPGGFRLLTGYGLSTLERSREALATALALGLGLGLLFGVGSGALLARLVNHRVTAIGTVVERFAAGDRSERLAVGGRRDPFDRLGHAINAMLDRIEHLVEEVRLITDGLAHDLRSPLIRLRARGEQALAAADTPASQAALEAMLREGDALLRILSTMLEVSRAEAGLGQDLIAPVDLAALARDLVEIYEPLAEERGVAITFAGGDALVWPGNRELIAQALSNLIDNALSHGAGAIEVGTGLSGGAACLSVADRGTGIEAQRRGEAVRRFARLDPARQIGGAGLGLALVDAIARLHGGTLQLGDNAPGLRASIVLPGTG